MLFNSPIFLVFATVFFGAWHLLRRQSDRLTLLVLASFVFYGYWDWRFVFLLLASGLIDFTAARLMVVRPARRRLLLFVSIAANLGLLGTFKYLGFLTGVAVDAAAVVGLTLEPPQGFGQLILPVGISFYTFQSMSYTIDVFRGRLEPTRSPILFFAYLSMFTQLVAGPIERAEHILPQLATKRSPTPRQCRDGWRLLVYGFFKKTCLADNLAPFVDEAFAAPAPRDSATYWWIVAAAFGMQIYCDFSGYSNIARGLGKLMGIDLVVNFDRPYVSRSFREFWGRWHISLSTWFRDYVYIGLGGGRRGRLRGHVNLWITMLLSGLWHGAGWTFLAWGAVHAALLSVERVTRWPQRIEPLGRAGSLVSLITVLGFVTASWIVFRAESIGQAGAILRCMVDPTAFDWPVESSLPMTALAFGVLALVVSILRGERPVRSGRRDPELILLPVVVCVTIFLRGPGHAFIYFQF